MPRKEALASLPRGLETEHLDQPLAVVAILEIPQGHLQLLKVPEVPHSEQLLFEGTEKALDAAVALQLAEKGRKRLHAEESQLLLRVAAHGRRAVVVANAQPGGHLGPEASEVLAEPLAQGFQRFKPVGLLRRVNAHALGRGVVDDGEYRHRPPARVTVAEASVPRI